MHAVTKKQPIFEEKEGGGGEEEKEALECMVAG